MAGDWLKIEFGTPDKPEVVLMASRLGINPDEVVGKLIRIWRWFNEHTKDGNANGVTYAFLDRVAGVTGFAEQMVFVGWLSENGSVFTLPNFDYHNGESAKKRAETQKRVAKHRLAKTEESNANVTQKALQKALPEKRREENKTYRVAEHPLPDWLPADAWIAFCEMRRLMKKPINTSRAANGVIGDIDRLRKAGYSPLELLDEATKRNWLTVYEPKQGAKPAVASQFAGAV